MLPRRQSVRLRGETASPASFATIDTPTAHTPDPSFAPGDSEAGPAMETDGEDAETDVETDVE